MNTTIRSMQIAQQAADTPDRVEYRIRFRKASELARADVAARWPNGFLTTDAARAALTYQSERIEHHLAALAGQP